MADPIPICPSCRGPVVEEKSKKKEDDSLKWTCRNCGSLTNPDYIHI